MAGYLIIPPWRASVARRGLRRSLGFVALGAFLISLFALTIQSSFNPVNSADAAGAQWLRTDGNKIVNESGQPIVLRGANIVRYNWKFSSESAMELDFNVARTFTRPIAQGGWGANSYTIWVDSNPVLNNHNQYMRWVDGMVDIARENDAYVILSWHADNPQNAHPERITGNGFRAMAQLARRYRDVPNVVYAAQAEPGFWTNSASRWRELRDQQERMVDSIRGENPRALVGVSGTNWSQNVHWVLDDPVRRENIFIKPHLYAGFDGIMSSRRINEIAQQWPVVIGEFGTGSRMSNTDTRNMIRHADQHLSGWQAWNLADEGPPVMLNSHGSVSPTNYGQLVKTELERQVNPPAPVPNPDPNPSHNETVFDDTLRWENWSWSTTVNPNVSSPVHAGNRALGVTYDSAWAGLSLHRLSLDTSPYNYLEFAIHTNGNPMPNVGVSLYNTSGDIIRVVSLSDYTTPAGNGWSLVSIPLADLGATNTTVTRVQLQEAAGAAQPTFFLDEIRFLGTPTTPPPTPTPQPPTPTPTLIPTPTPEPVATHPVFDNALHWENWSWSTTVNPNVSSPVHAGSHALGVTYNAAWAGLSLHRSSLNTGPYSHLEFAIHPNGNPMPNIGVSLYNTSGDIIRVVSLSDYTTPAGNGWSLVSIPLSDLGATSTTITRVQVQEAAGSAQPTFFLDEIRFASQPTVAAAVSPSSGVLLASATKLSPSQEVVPTQLSYVPGSTVRVSQLSGDFDPVESVPTLSRTGSQFGLHGTDLGSSFEHQGKLYFLFGDTWGRPGFLDTMAWSDSADPERITLDFHRGHDGLWLPLQVPGIKHGAFEVPSGGTSINDTIYVAFTTDHSIHKAMGRSVLAASNDDGRTFQNLYELSRNKFINVSFWEADGWLYIYGSGDYRQSSVYLARVRPGDIADRSQLRYFSGTDAQGAPRWSVNEAEAVSLFQHNVVGEFSVAYLEPAQRYVMLYNSHHPRGIILRNAETPWGPWSEKEVVFEPWQDGGYGNFMHVPAGDHGPGTSFSDLYRDHVYGGEYGPYVMARYTTAIDGGVRIYYTMSTWNPYQVVVMSTDLELEPHDSEGHLAKAQDHDQGFPSAEVAGTRHPLRPALG